MALLRSRLQDRERERRVSELTAKELSEMKEVKAYKAVGKMYTFLTRFVAHDLKLLQDDLFKKSQLAEKEIAAMQTAALKYDKELKEAEKNMESLMKKVQSEVASVTV